MSLNKNITHASNKELILHVLKAAGVEGRIPDEHINTLATAIKIEAVCDAIDFTFEDDSRHRLVINKDSMEFFDISEEPQTKLSNYWIN